MIIKRDKELKFAIRLSAVATCVVWGIVGLVFEVKSASLFVCAAVLFGLSVYANRRTQEEE